MKSTKSNFRKFFVTVLVLTLLLITFVAPVAAKSPGQAPNVQASGQVIRASDAAENAPLPFKDMAVGGVPIVLFVTGMVSWIKKLGVKDKWLTVSSLFIGLLFGIAYQYYLTPLITYQLWFVAVLYGLFLGYIACNVYDAYGNGSTSSAAVTNVITGVLSSEDKSNSTPTA